MQPKSAEYIDTATAQPLTVVAFGNGTLSYQWYSNTANSNTDGTLLEGATESSYTPVISDQGKTQEKEEYYYCVVTNTIDDVSYETVSDVAVITTRPDPTPYNLVLMEGETPISEDGYSYAAGDDGATITVFCDSDAEGGEWSYEWQCYWVIEDGQGQNFVVEGATEASLKIPTARDSKSTYYCNVTHTVDGVSYTKRSPEVKVNVTVSELEAPVFVKHPEDVEYFFGTTILNELTAEAEASGYRLYYFWESSADGYTFTRVTEDAVRYSTSMTYRPEATGETMYYRCGAYLQTISISGDTITSETAYSQPAKISYGKPGWDGEGTKESPFLLKTTEDVVLLQQIVNNGTPMEDNYFKMTADIELPEDWEPIGTQKNYFSGNIDGDGHLLTVPEGGLPLLGRTLRASLSNLDIYEKRIEGYGVVNIYTVTRQGTPITIDNVTLKSGTQTLMSGFIGGYASGVDRVIIRNCTVEEGVIIGYDKNQESIGSFAGEFNGYMYNCVSYATVYGTNRVGGLMGNKGQSMGPCEVKNCVFGGNVVASGNFAGGIISNGYDVESAPNTPAVTIVNCLVTGNVTGKDYVGGILGAEHGLYQCRANGIGYIQNNLFVGKVSAEGENVGGIIGFMRSLDRYNIITNNYYAEDCGAQSGIGQVESVDTNCETHETVSGAYYGTTVSYHRTDDPLGADKEKLTASATAEELKNGTIRDLLNNGENSYCNWTQEENHPVLDGKNVAMGLEISGEYKTRYYIGEEIDLTGMVLTATWSDGTTTEVSADDVTIIGYDNTLPGAKTVTIQYGAAKAEFEVLVLKVKEEESEADTTDVIFTLSEDDKFVVSKETDDIMAGVEVDLSYFDLENYGLEKYYLYDENYDVVEQPTVLHLYIYMLEVYYCGVDPDEAGEGYLYEEDLLGTDTLGITGGAGSMYMTYFWGHDQNLSYNVNGVYPLEKEGWGATADQIVLSDGDYVDVAMYTDWSFYSDDNAGFRYFMDEEGNVTHAYTVEPSKDVTVVYGRAVTDYNGTYETSYTTAAGTVYYGTELYGTDAKSVETDENGKVVLNFAEEGTYYLWADGQKGTSTDGIVSSPAYAKVVIAPKVPEKEEVIRSAGENRYDTAYKVADTYKETLGVEKFEAVIVATGTNFADALSGSYLATVKNAPILLTNGKAENVAQLHAYIKDNISENGIVYILGGTDAVPADVAVIEGFAGEVKRLSGDNRYETNLEILAEAGVAGTELLVATGKTFADSLSASATGRPILLVKPGAELTDAQKAVAESFAGGTIYVLGGEAAVSEEIANVFSVYGEVKRLSGATRYETSVAIAETFFENVKEVVAASGRDENFPDGLCGGPLAATLNVPLLLTQDDNAEATTGYVTENNIHAGYVLGGTAALADESIVDIFTLESAEEIIVK